jgi:cell division protease FtsH
LDEHAAPLIKVTIVPRGQSLGAAWYLPEERLIARPNVRRNVEEERLSKLLLVATGALSDLEK